MRKFFSILIIGLLFSLTNVKATVLREETDNYISRVNSEVASFKTTIANFNSYLNTNKASVSNALTFEILEEIGKALQNDDYNLAFDLLEDAVNDNELTNMNVASKINQYLSLKSDLINFVNTNADELNFENGTVEGIECSLDLYDALRDNFNSVKPTLSDTINYLGKILEEVIKINLNSKKDVANNKVEDIIEEYRKVSSILSTLVTKYNNSLGEYESVFTVIGGVNQLFNVTIKNKFRADLNQILSNAETNLQAPIEEFISDRWDMLRENVNELIESDKDITTKNEIIYEKIDQVTSVNEKFVSAINEILGSLDIMTIKEKVDLILERGNTEFASAIEYLHGALIIGDYDINLVSGHDNSASINRAKEIIILEKLFDIEEFKRQIELANNIGTLEFNLGNYDYVPNKASVVVSDNNQTQKEYKVIVKGDVNGNANITITDAIEAAYYSIGSKELDEYQSLAADLNNNGTVTITDVYLIAKKAIEGGI